MNLSMRAERRLGDLIPAQRETVGLAIGKRKDLVLKKRTMLTGPILADPGFDKKLSNWKSYAASKTDLTSGKRKGF